MHPFHHAQNQADKAAYIMAGSGETVTYGQLDARSNQGAHLFRSLGLQRGDVIALMMENNARYFEIAWAAQRAGLYFVCVSTKLTAAEAQYILEDCGAKVFITSPAMGPVIDEIAKALPGLTLYALGGTHGPYVDFEAARAPMPTTPIADESAGSDML